MGACSYEETLERIKNLMVDKISYPRWMTDDAENDLLCGRSQIAPRDLLCLFFFIEQEFGIHISKDYIKIENFDTLRHIAEMVQNILDIRVSEKIV